MIIFAAALLLACLPACDKNNEGPGDLPLAFESLTIDSDSIPVGGTARVTARATGSGLLYHWSVTAGALLGSGEEVIYTTDPCQPGEHTITCRVADKRGDEASLSVKVYVYF
jgi:hypothetical protein